MTSAAIPINAPPRAAGAPDNNSHPPACQPQSQTQAQPQHQNHHQQHQQHHKQRRPQSQQPPPPGQHFPLPAAPAAAPQTAQNASPPSRMDLKSWWKGFQHKKGQNQDSQQQQAQDIPHQGIFGIPLHESIRYANVAISLVDENGDSYIYGYVPIVVAKCGVFLKEKATGVEGIFRLSGSEKRIKELKTIFDSPGRYGKGLVWDGYTVHDAANVFRRYLNDLPQPVVPLELYEGFRGPLKGATKKTFSDGDGPQFVEDFDLEGAIRQYQRLIMELPPLNRQLLLYILDLLAVFAAKEDENRMNSQNLAAVFSPGIISHPNHAMAPEEYRLNQCVLIFLIEHQDHFLIGMQAPPGTETAASTAETQPSNAEKTASTTTASEPVAPPPAAAQADSVSAPAPAPTVTTATVGNPGPPVQAPSAASNNGDITNATPAQVVAPANAEPPTSRAVSNEAPPAGTVASNEAPPRTETISSRPIPVIAAPQADKHDIAQTPINSHEHKEGLGSPSLAIGLSRSKSVPSNGRKKLRKPRPASGNPSAQTSQTSLGLVQS